MSSASSANLSRGRINQKFRTRSELLRAARAVIERGETLSVAAAAREASMSVATAYRYFNDPDRLAAEAVLDADLAPSGDLVTELALRLEGVSDVVERVLNVNRMLFVFTRRTEASYRLFLAKCLEQSAKSGRDAQPALRGGRRIAMFELALEPVRARFGRDAFADLVHGLAAACGLETYIVLKDICRLPEAEIDRIAESNLRAILDSALARAEALQRSSRGGAGR